MKRFFLSERNMMIVILLNAVVLFALYFPACWHHPVLEGIDYAFILVFLVEALVKIRHYGWSGYISDNWNKFDFVIVLASLPSLLVHIVPVPDTSLLIILRLFRLVRLIRFLRFIPHLGKIMEGLGRALKASVFVLAALLFLNLLLAIFTCHFYAKVAPEYFGDPLISAYSIFQMFTIEGWNEIPASIAVRMAEDPDGVGLGSDVLIGLTRFYFLLVVLVGGVFGMSLANAVFVDEMTMDNNEDLERKIDYLQAELAELKDMLRERG